MAKRPSLRHHCRRPRRHRHQHQHRHWRRCPRRVGDGTKIVLTGDINQIDNPYLDASSNGLSYLIERFKGQPMYGHVTLLKTERSTLASLAAEIL